MVLVPYDMIQNTLGENRDSARLSGLLRPPPLQKVLNLDRQMTEILNDQSMTEDEKAVRYSQLLQELRHFKTKGQKRETLPVRIVGDKDDSSAPGVLETEIVNSVPTTMIQKTRQLMDKIKTLPGLKWDEQTGEVSVDGQVIQDSHLLDLVHDAIRPRKTAPDPAGWEEFSQALVKGGVPIEFIHNPKRREYIRKKRLQTYRSPVGKNIRGSPVIRKKGEDLFSTPVVKRTGRVKKTRIKPLNWTQIPWDHAEL